MKNENVDIGKIIADETAKRLKIMENPDYEFPEKANIKDAIIIILSILTCMLLIIGCMTGVIV